MHSVSDRLEAVLFRVNGLAETFQGEILVLGLRGPGAIQPKIGLKSKQIAWDFSLVEVDFHALLKQADQVRGA